MSLLPADAAHYAPVVEAKGLILIAVVVVMANGEEDYWPCDPATMMLDPQFYDVPSKVIPLYVAAPSTPQPAP